MVDPEQQKKLDQVFFGASVTYANERGNVKPITIGIDEADLSRGQVSWVSPVARARRVRADVEAALSPGQQPGNIGRLDLL